MTENLHLGDLAKDWERQLSHCKAELEQGYSCPIILQ